MSMRLLQAVAMDLGMATAMVLMIMHEIKGTTMITVLMITGMLKLTSQEIKGKITDTTMAIYMDLEEKDRLEMMAHFSNV